MTIRTSIFRINAMLPAVRHEDATWYYAAICAWTCAEVCAAIIALSAPALKPLVGTWLRGESLNGSKGYTNFDTKNSTNGTGTGTGTGSKNASHNASYAMKSMTGSRCG